MPSWLSNSKFCCLICLSVCFCFLHVNVIRLCCLFQKIICIGNIDAVTTHFLRKYCLFSFCYPFSLLKKIFIFGRTQ